jgi:hypothetical protein
MALRRRAEALLHDLRWKIVKFTTEFGAVFDPEAEEVMAAKIKEFRKADSRFRSKDEARAVLNDHTEEKAT